MHRPQTPVGPRASSGKAQPRQAWPVVVVARGRVAAEELVGGSLRRVLRRLDGYARAHGRGGREEDAERLSYGEAGDVAAMSQPWPTKTPGLIATPAFASAKIGRTA